MCLRQGEVMLYCGLESLLVESLDLWSGSNSLPSNDGGKPVSLLCGLVLVGLGNEPMVSTLDQLE
jgi:hypothetical protein